jgi:hypothetical protein
LIVPLIVALIIAAAVWWIVSLIPLPQPAKNIALAVLALIFLLYIVTHVFHVQIP